MLRAYFYKRVWGFNFRGECEGSKILEGGIDDENKIEKYNRVITFFIKGRGVFSCWGSVNSITDVNTNQKCRIQPNFL